MKLRHLLPALLTLALAACATGPERPPPGADVPMTPVAPLPIPRVRPACADCGRVERIEIVQAVRATKQGRAVLGGVVGGVVTGKDASASAPTRDRQPRPATRRISVRMDDGRRLVIHQNIVSPDLRVGTAVRVIEGRVIPAR